MNAHNIAPRTGFSIIRATRQAWRLVYRQAGLLARMAALPVATQGVTSWALALYRPEASAFERYIWELPANTLIAWFFFAATRLVVLGENIHALPQDESFIRARDKNMKAAILVTLLFMAGAAVFFGAIEGLARHAAASTAPDGKNPLSWVAFILTGAALWGLRFSVAHIPAALGYPLRLFIRRIDGPGFSLRLVGLAAAALLPVFVLSQILVAVFLPAELENITPEQIRTLTLAGQPLAVVWLFLYNIAAAFGLRHMFRWGEKP